MTLYTYGRERIAAYQEGTRLKYLYDMRGSVAGTIRQENIPEGVKTQAESGGHAVLAGHLGKSSYRYTPFGEIGLRRRRKRRGRVPVQWGSL